MEEKKNKEQPKKIHPIVYIFFFIVFMIFFLSIWFTYLSIVYKNDLQERLHNASKQHKESL